MLRRAANLLSVAACMTRPGALTLCRVAPVPQQQHKATKAHIEAIRKELAAKGLHRGGAGAAAAAVCTADASLWAGGPRMRCLQWCRGLWSICLHA